LTKALTNIIGTSWKDLGSSYPTRYCQLVGCVVGV
jgi:hypothetical protein